jgi:hypothetical protein
VDARAETVSIAIHRPTERAPGDRVQVIFDEHGRPLRLTEEPSGDWVVVSIEPYEERRLGAGPAMPCAMITLKREPTAT